MRLNAFAKINLDLRVGELRVDGYHNVRTVLETIDWSDEIQITAAKQFAFEAYGAPSDESNLVVRAVRQFEGATGAPVCARIVLTKSIPAGAGLGGGSADAAVTLMGLQRFTGRRLPGGDLLLALRSLGADVPFFAVGGRAVGIGRGDEIFPLQDGKVAGAPYWLVLVNPGVPVATAEAYSWLTGSDKTHTIEGFCAQFLSGGAAEDGSGGFNDFESVVFARHPAFQEIRDELLGRGAFRAALSGSGCVLFGMFRQRGAAESAAALFEGRLAVRVSRPLARAEYQARIFASED